MIRDLTPHELAYVHREILADRVEKLQAERIQLTTDLAEAKARVGQLEVQLAQERGES